MRFFSLLILLIFSTSILASPAFAPQELEVYKGLQKANMSRLRVNLTVSGNDHKGKINVSNFTLCSAASCWKIKVNRYVPVVNSSTTRGYLIADVLIPMNEQLREVFFEPTTGNQSIRGRLKFGKKLNIEPEYLGHNLYIVLDKRIKNDKIVYYYPISSTALPYNPEIKYYLIDPKFNQLIQLNSKSEILFPAKFLPKPQLFFIAENDVGKRFPMLEIYPYVQGKGNVKIKLAEIKKRNVNLSSDQLTSIQYSEITSAKTRVISGSNTPSRVVSERHLLWLQLLKSLRLYEL
ncbi:MULTISPECIES: hypothetical protein [Pseudomonadota]|jgi:hypothetical protein|uniref:hypothetical protein n=2 Tax=Pseudomonadota TaxID=1224 RepID=UPI0002CD7F11|nr:MULTISPECIES: hypothetical protein [Pseudomonadota]ENX25736.1 hypothetical protein F893_00024 [Acinetobacter sp. CIP 102136]MCO8086711.1 hypothetical protein [Acinetobacter lwoffii]